MFLEMVEGKAEGTVSSFGTFGTSFPKVICEINWEHHQSNENRLNDVQKMTVILNLGHFNGIMLKLYELCFHMPCIVCSYHSPENIKV